MADLFWLYQSHDNSTTRIRATTAEFKERKDFAFYVPSTGQSFFAEAFPSALHAPPLILFKVYSVETASIYFHI